MLLEKKMIVQCKRKQLHVAGAGVRKLWSRKKTPRSKTLLGPLSSRVSPVVAGISLI